ncbi:benzoate 4-monooxygenase cytochrome-like protein P450 [Phaeosphaeria sp. MPI-PUGE-AT-0046c]|nr:benzoate 4-monooxygenase cytochrome-like protein P450 [Phaeosphaeria sp. MPI-PUGE-AT-0046c]
MGKTIMSGLVHRISEYGIILGVSTVLLITVNIIYNLFLHPLRSYPGPKSWAATRLTWAHAMQSGHLHHKLHELHTRYGPIVRIAPNELAYIDNVAWKDIYGNRALHKNGTWTGQEEEKHPVSIVSTDEATHLRNRRALAGAFTELAIAQHAFILEDLIGTMLKTFQKSAENGQSRTTINVTEWLNFLTFDISGALSFGDSFDSVKSGRAHPWVEISCNFGKGIAMMASINFFRPLDKLLKLAMPKKMMAQMQYHKQLSHEEFEQRLAMQNKNNTLDYVGSIVAYNEEKGETKIPKEEIEQNMTLLIFAGSETTSTAMTAILTHLLQSPTALAKVQHEVRASFRDEDDITVKNTAHLKYLDAVVQEGIRMAPPAPISQPRVTPKEGATIAGRRVPPGTFVSVNQYPTFRSTSNFTDPNSFIPERFLSTSPFPEDKLDAFEPFLLGRHKCIGQKLAWAIMRLTLARLLYKFDMQLVSDASDFGEQKTYMFWEKKPLNIELRLWA